MSRRKILIPGLAAAAGLAIFLGMRLMSSPDAQTKDVSAPGLPAEPEILLDEPDREFLWQTENAGLRLGKRGWKHFGTALKNADRAELLGLLAPKFVAHFGEPSHSVKHDSPNLQVSRIERAEPFDE